MTMTAPPRFGCDGPDCDVEQIALSRGGLTKVGWIVANTAAGEHLDFCSHRCAANRHRRSFAEQLKLADALVEAISSAEGSNAE